MTEIDPAGLKPPIVRRAPGISTAGRDLHTKTSPSSRRPLRNQLKKLDEDAVSGRSESASDRCRYLSRDVIRCWEGRLLLTTSFTLSSWCLLIFSLYICNVDFKHTISFVHVKQIKPEWRIRWQYWKQYLHLFIHSLNKVLVLSYSSATYISKLILNRTLWSLFLLWHLTIHSVDCRQPWLWCNSHTRLPYNFLLRYFFSSWKYLFLWRRQ